MLLDWLGQIFVALTFAGCAGLVVVLLGMLYLLRLHLSLRREGLAREAASLAQPLPPDAELPHVVVQIPTFNEGMIVERAVAAATRLDWPRDKLHIQICDDSTDRTTTFAKAATQRAVEVGFDVVLIHRTARSEFKAGALNNARAQTPHDYFAILDVDYVPEPDFLRRCMTVLLADPELAFVQARVDFLNADENAMTRAQAIMLDYHLGFEQATRSWAKHLLPFNGTCGIWRRAAIDAAGGWHGHTLLEDWDLSLRAWLKGWRGTFLVTVTAKGELPTDIVTWMAQQKRWVTGVGQVAWKLFPAIRSRHDIRSRAFWDTLIPFGTWLAYAMFAAAPTLAAKPPFDPARDVTHIAFFGGPPALFAVHPSIPTRTLREFVAFAKARPRQMVFGSPGNGTLGHLFGVLFTSRAGLAIEHVPYKSASGAVVDIVAGHIQTISTTLSTAAPQVRAGRIRPLAISATERVQEYAQVPTFRESGYPELVATVWFALSGPPGLPAEIVQRLNAETQRILSLPEVRERLRIDGIVPQSMSAQAFQEFVAAELGRWAPIIRASGATAN